MDFKLQIDRIKNSDVLLHSWAYIDEKKSPNYTLNNDILHERVK
jgi:hypothetical protein